MQGLGIEDRVMLEVRRFISTTEIQFGPLCDKHRMIISKPACRRTAVCNKEERGCTYLYCKLQCSLWYMEVYTQSGRTRAVWPKKFVRAFLIIGRVQERARSRPCCVDQWTYVSLISPAGWSETATLAKPILITATISRWDFYFERGGWSVV